jgi:hypothetical protein
MNYAGWGEIWKLALAQVGAQSVQLRILIGLGIAFVALMIVEGLRVSFITGHRSPSRRGIAEETPPRKKSVRKAAGAETRSFAAPSGPFRARAVEPTQNPKRTKTRISRHRAARPIIRRAPENELASVPQPTFAEEAAPFSPFPGISSHFGAE